MSGGLVVDALKAELLSLNHVVRVWRSIEEGWWKVEDGSSAGTLYPLLPSWAQSVCVCVCVCVYVDIDVCVYVCVCVCV